MNLSLTAVQRLLVFSSVAWAVSPRWGGFAFAASWVLLFVATRSRVGRAREVLTANLHQLGALPEEALALARRFPLAAVWPSSAERWGTTWQLTGLLALFEGGIFVLWALGTQQWWHLLLLGPAAVQLVSGGWMARRLKLAERVTEDLQAEKSSHDKAMTLLRLKTATGQWPPEPNPDGEPRAEPKEPLLPPPG